MRKYCSHAASTSNIALHTRNKGRTGHSTGSLQEGSAEKSESARPDRGVIQAERGGLRHSPTSQRKSGHIFLLLHRERSFAVAGTLSTWT